MSVISIYSSRSIPLLVRKRLFERSGVRLAEVIQSVTPLIEEVRLGGDVPILAKYASRQVPITSLKVSRSEIAEAITKVSPAFIEAVKQVRSNLTTVSQDQLVGLQQQKTTTLLDDSVQIWRRWRADDVVGIYAPGGRANYPSTVLMCAIPALIAGCRRLVLTVPPQTDGSLPPELLVVANLLGISDIFKVGGAQAIAAMAYGTQTIPKVSLVVGPGNQYVTAAKVALFPTIRIDAPAGPSENLIIADTSANPAWVAADLLTDCEHGPDSTGILLTTSMALAKRVQQAISRQIVELSTGETIVQSLLNYSAIIVTSNLEEAVDLANEYAPEHIQIMTQNARRIASKIINAGSVFVGNYSSKAAGDYATGANHVLPTAGQARTFGPLSVETFGKYVEFQRVSRQGLKKMRSAIQIFAEVERLPAHKVSVSIRFEQPKL